MVCGTKHGEIDDGDFRGPQAVRTPSHCAHRPLASLQVQLSNWAPGLQRILQYDRSWLRGDLIAGVTVAAYLIPQVMAYSEVAGLPPVAGLWTVLGAMTIYAFLGSSRHLSVGPETTTSLMTAVAVGPLAAGDPARFAVLAGALALIVGLICFIGWVTRVGFIADLLSKPVLIGYLAGVAVLMIVGQLDALIGVELSGERTVELIVEFATNLGETHLPTLILGLGVLAALFGGTRLFPKAPVPLLAILGAAAAVALLDLGSNGVDLVGAIPAGLPTPQLPLIGWDDFSTLLLPAAGVTMVAFTDNALTGRAFATKGGYRIDSSQELLALGGANIAAGLAQGFPVSSSGSRTVIGMSLGAQSQLFSLVAVVMVALTLLFLRPVLATFPEVALAAVVIWAAFKLVDMAELRRIGSFRKSELMLSLATAAGVVVFGILNGVGVAVSLSIVDLLRRTARPHDGILGYVPDVAGMHDIDDYPDARQVPGLIVYRYDAPLFFANADNFKERALASLDQAEGEVEWFLLNFEANVQIDLTAIDALAELHDELAEMGITLAVARVKFEMLDELEKAGLVDRIGKDHVFATLPTAVAAYIDSYTSRHGGPPPGVVAPTPPTPPIGG